MRLRLHRGGAEFKRDHLISHLFHLCFKEAPVTSLHPLSIASRKLGIQCGPGRKASSPCLLARVVIGAVNRPRRNPFEPDGPLR